MQDQIIAAQFYNPDGLRRLASWMGLDVTQLLHMCGDDSLAESVEEQIIAYAQAQELMYGGV